MAAVATFEELARRGTGLAGPFIHCAFFGGMNIGENGSEAQGLSKVDIEHTGLRYSATGDLIFEDVQVPFDNIASRLRLLFR